MSTSFARRLSLLALACVALAQGVADAADPLRVTKPANATREDLNPQRTYSAPDLAVHPDNPKIIVGGFGDFRTKACGLIRSTDGGATWRIVDANPNLPSYPYCLANNSNIFQANIAFGRDGTLYMGMVAWDTQDTRSKASVALARSTDLGDTWTTTLVRDARPTAPPTQESNRPVTGIAVDTRTGNDDTVYVAYRRSMPNQPPGNAIPGAPMVAVSTDGGRTFSESVSVVGATFEDAAIRDRALTARTTAPPNPNTTTTLPPAGSRAETPNQAANFGGTNFGITIDNRGTVYSVWRATTSNVTPPIPPSLWVSKSSDKGRSWTHFPIRNFDYSFRGNARVAWSPRGGAEGTLHVVYEGTHRPEVNAFGDIYHQRSLDGGRTWSEPRRLPDDNPDNLAGKYIPNIRVAPNGRIDVVWWDTRSDPGIRANDVYLTSSDDNGETWSANIRVTDQTVDRRFGVWGNNFDQNSPPSLASVDEFAVVAWDDTRFSRDDGSVVATDPIGEQGFGGGVQDIFVAAVQFETIGGGTSSVAKAVLAGVVGLVAVGLVLLVVVMAGRRKEGPPPERAVTGKAPVGVS